MQIEQVQVGKLIPYANNARTHTEAQVAQIAASIREFGFNNPILIDEQSTIIAGHGRVLAAQALELKEVPCIRLTHLTPSQRKAYVIADNKIALNSGWDEELLKLELEGMTDIEQIATGFSPEELNLLFHGWQSDIDRMDNIDAKDTTAKEKIVITCNGDEKELLREKITNLIDDLGLHDVDVS
jgi:ParB-like chromosome segregation protein Spo0J